MSFSDDVTDEPEEIIGNPCYRLFDPARHVLDSLVKLSETDPHSGVYIAYSAGRARESMESRQQGLIRKVICYVSNVLPRRKE